MKKLLLLSAFLIAGFSVGVKNADANNVCEYPVVGWLAEQFGWWGCDHKNNEISNTIDHSQVKNGTKDKHGGGVDAGSKANASKEYVDEIKKGTGNEIRATEKKLEEGIHKTTEEIKNKAHEVVEKVENKISEGAHNMDDKVQKMAEHVENKMTEGVHNMDNKMTDGIHNPDHKMTEGAHNMADKMHDKMQNVERKIDEVAKSLPSHNSGSTSEATHKAN